MKLIKIPYQATDGSSSYLLLKCGHSLEDAPLGAKYFAELPAKYFYTFYFYV